jgi:hypothetical protein
MRIVQTSPPNLFPRTRKGVTMSNHHGPWLRVLQDADGNEETELITIDRDGDHTPPVIELTNGVRITCTQPAVTSTAPREQQT